MAAEVEELEPSDLDKKIIEHFSGFVVRKDLTKGLKQNAVVPTYVLEYLLGQHCATDDESVMMEGLESVHRILSKHYVHRNEAELVKSTIREKGRHKIIDKIQVTFNETKDQYEAAFYNTGIKRIPLHDDWIRRYPKLLIGGVWSIVDVAYEFNEEEPKSSPWAIEKLKPIQVANVDYQMFLDIRSKFSTEEWIGLLMQSIGFNPEMFSRRGKLLALMRLVPFCERNYNLIELGPKGTGKSHIYSEFSPHGMLISGSEVTVPKLFVSNTKRADPGLVSVWDCICFDEFAGKDKKVDKALVDIMKNYMANRTFSRGVSQESAEASMVFMGNTKKSVAFMLKHSHFFDQLHDKYTDSAFLDRLHAFLPGWEVSPVRSELFTNGYGFIVDYLAEILKAQRNEDFTGAYKQYFSIESELTTRDQIAFEKTFSGLVKLLYPDGNFTEEECDELLSFALESRRRVREHIIRIDDTFPHNDFTTKSKFSGKLKTILGLEEIQYAKILRTGAEDADEPLVQSEPKEQPETAKKEESEDLVPGEHLAIPENAKGVSFQGLFAKYLNDARQITVSDPYIRLFWQVKNMMEFLEVVYSLVPDGEQVEVKLITKSDQDKCVEQDQFLTRLVESFQGSKVDFSFEYNNTDSFHARSISTDTGWKILIDRGLDIFQRYDNDTFSIASKIQTERLCKSFEVTYLKEVE